MSGLAVVVVGSANRDHVTRVPWLPAPGETVLAERTSLGLGGKGMNQAVAAALCGAAVTFVGAVGADEAGAEVSSALRRARIEAALLRSAELPTGAAYVSVGPTGENCIVVAAGANAEVSPEQVAAATATVPNGAVFVTQLEIPLDAVRAVAEAARSRSGRLVLNLAPYTDVPADLLAAADPLVVNEHEALATLRLPELPPGGFPSLATALADRCRSVVVTAGAKGAVLATATTAPRWQHAPTVPVVDATGAGDAFVGALAAALASGAELPAATALSVRAASLSVGAEGAQASYSRLVLRGV